MRSLIWTPFVLAATGAAAQSSGRFDNDPIVSPLFTSPAQYYQTTVPKAQFAFATFHGNATYNYDEINVDQELRGNAIAATYSARLPETPLAFAATYTKFDLGIGVKYRSDTIADFGSDVNIDDKKTILGIAVAYEPTPKLSAGAAFDVNHVDRTSDVGDDASFDYSTFKPGIVYHTELFELGLVYSPTININDDGATETSAGSVLIHGQLRANQNLVVGGKIENLRKSSLNDDELKDSWKFSVASELAEGEQFMLGGAVDYETESADAMENRAADNVGTLNLNIYGVIGVTPAARIGASLSMIRTGDHDAETEFGGETLKGTVSQQVTTLAVTAAWTF